MISFPSMNNLNHQVIGVASGKGGVGKTTISVNLALAMAQQRKKVALIDADLGLANAQIALGINAPFNISDVLSGRRDVGEVATRVTDGLVLIPGASGNSEMANLNSLQAHSFLQAVFDTFQDLDVIFIDMAAGLSDSGLTFLRACNIKVVVAQDEPASLADAYGLIKLQKKENSMKDIILLPNRVTNELEGRKLFNKLNGVCMRFLEEPVKYIQSVHEDKNISEASRHRENLFVRHPSSKAVSNFLSLAEKILEGARQPA